MPVRTGELSKAEGRAAAEARTAFREAILQGVAPADQLSVAVTAATALFVDTAAFAFRVARPELVEMLNRHLAQLGLQLVEAPRN